MKLTKNTTKVIRKWLKANGFKCGCRLGEEMCYYPDKKRIDISREYSKEPDKHFMNFLRVNGLNKRFNPITMSVLHELGHHMTAKQFTENEWLLDSLLKMEISCKNLPYGIKLNKYWKTDTEFSANKWAIFYATTFPNKVKELELEIMKTIEE